MSRQVTFLIYRDFQLLDAAGPIAALEIAERHRPGSYSLRVVASEAGSVMSSAGGSMQASSFGRTVSVDTLVVAGGDGSRSALSCLRTRRFIQSCATKARRTSSVCSGAYLLAAAGILDGKRATTHWSRSIDFARRFPACPLGARPHFHQGWPHLDLRRNYRWHRPVASFDRRGFGRGSRSADGAAVGGLLPTPWRPVAILGVAGDGAGQRKVRCALGLCSQQSREASYRGRSCRPGLHEFTTLLTRVSR